MHKMRKTREVGSSCNDCYFYLEGVQFESQMKYSLPWPRFLLIFLGLSIIASFQTLCNTSVAHLMIRGWASG
jgi:uncharacterized membrane protein YadS